MRAITSVGIRSLQLLGSFGCGSAGCSFAGGGCWPGCVGTSRGVMLGVPGTGPGVGFFPGAGSGAGGCSGTGWSGIIGPGDGGFWRVDVQKVGDRCAHGAGCWCGQHSACPLSPCARAIPRCAVHRGSVSVARFTSARTPPRDDRSTLPRQTFPGLPRSRTGSKGDGSRLGACSSGSTANAGHVVRCLRPEQAYQQPTS